ncbi:hypothetical protein V1509DRAFT_126797 [Lipomyces kononenkoae]
MEQLEPGNPTSSLAESDRIEEITDLEIETELPTYNETPPPPKSILKPVKNDSHRPNALDVEGQEKFLVSEPSTGLIDSELTDTASIRSQPAATEQTQPQRNDGFSGISSDIFEIERIAQAIELPNEEDGEDILDLEITDRELSWQLADDDDDDDANYDSEAFDEDEDDDENEDQYGRSRGTFFPYLPRGLNTPVAYGSGSLLSAYATKEAIEHVPKTTRPVHSLDDEQASPFSEMSLEHVSSQRSTGNKQVRFSEKVAVQHFQSKLPSASVSTSSGPSPSSHSNGSVIAAEELKPEHHDEPKPKKVSQFKLNRKKSSSAEAVQTMKRSDAAEVHGDVIERQVSGLTRVKNDSVLGDRLESAESQGIRRSSAVVPTSSITNLDRTSNVNERDVPKSASVKANDELELIGESEPPPPIPSIKPGLRQSPAEPSRGVGNEPKPFTIRRPIPKTRPVNVASTPLSQPIDVEALIRENIIPNPNAPSNMLPLESEDEPKQRESSEPPLLSDTIVERPFEPPSQSDRRKKQSLFRASRTATVPATFPSTTSHPSPMSSEVVQRQDTHGEYVEDDLGDKNDDDMALDPEIHRQEIAVAYHRMRQKLLDQNSGYSVKVAEMDFVPLDENGEVEKISRFKSARLSNRTRSS